MSLEKLEEKHLGRAKDVVVTGGSTLFVDGKGSNTVIESRIKSIKALITSSKSVDEQEFLRKRVANLTGGVASMKVGGATQVEMKERIDRVDDALAATRASMEEGIIPGGGTAYARCVNGWNVL